MTKKRRLPILSILPTGASGFERWAINDEQNRRWTGEDFAQQGHRLYATYNAAACDTQRILRSHFEGVEPTLYLAPLFVEVLADQPVPEARVSEHLWQAARLYMNTPEHGHGPDGSLVLPWIDWSQMQKCKPGDGELLA